ncbi:MAG: NUDIX hydrolase [Gammaproteobacteria bacterium SHHR-1]
MIPYRICKDGVEILLVSSSSGRHWVVPKGIQEPGMSPQDSAAKEAREEAGILSGELGQQALGDYSYSKWGSPCQVQVYSMQVKQMVPDSDWDSGYRRRKWVSSDKVAGFLKQPELAELALRLARQVGV